MTLLLQSTIINRVATTTTTSLPSLWYSFTISPPRRQHGTAFFSLWNRQTTAITPSPNCGVVSLSVSYYSSFQDAPLTNLDYEANLYGYRVKVNNNNTRWQGFSSTTPLRQTSNNNINSNNNNDDHNDDDDFSEYQCHNDPIFLYEDGQNLDILASPEVQAILESQRDYDGSLRSESRIVKDMKDNVVESGYDSDYEEMTDCDWEELCSPSTQLETGAVASTKIENHQTNSYH